MDKLIIEYVSSGASHVPDLRIEATMSTAAQLIFPDITTWITTVITIWTGLMLAFITNYESLFDN